MNLKSKFIIFFIFFLYCQKITVEIYPEIEIDKNLKSVKTNNEICLHIFSDNINLETSKFLKAYTISRLFYSHVENRSGTLKEVLKEGVEKRFYDVPVKIIFKSELQSCLNFITIKVESYHFIWYPPQEFIQTPIPVRKGSFNVEFKATYIIKYDQKKKEKQFYQNFVQFILPQNEYITMQNTISQILRDFIEEIYKEYWL